jgi:hypothetical protein
MPVLASNTRISVIRRPEAKLPSLAEYHSFVDSGQVF